MKINVDLEINNEFVLSDSTQTYSEPCQTSKMEHFMKEVNEFQPLTIFAKRTITVVCQGSEYTSVICNASFKPLQI